MRSDVQNVLATAVHRIERHGGMLRQFIRDDKGAVIIWSFGLTHQAYVDSAQRGLDSALDVIAGLKALRVQQPDDDDDDSDGGNAGGNGGCGGGGSGGGSKSDRPPTERKKRWAATLRPVVGITSGTAYCGLVGAKYRSEYCIMGVSESSMSNVYRPCVVCLRVCVPVCLQKVSYSSSGMVFSARFLIVIMENSLPPH